LQRIAFGPLRLGALQEGQSRRLKPGEIASLQGE
jgi:16S rRNA U516 pseudouridylate synthase RsuA-like enzyme